jgi:hypothetical protein
MKISDTETLHVELGGLDFEVLSRELDDVMGTSDGGFSIGIYGPVAGERTAVLRFDLFRKAPHYHQPPSADGQIDIDVASEGEAFDWAMKIVREELPEMIEGAGFPELAASLDRGALRAGWRAVAEAAEQTRSLPKTPREFELPAPPAQ